MGRLRARCDYESLRNARISENKARMESLGLHRSAGELRLIISSSPQSISRSTNTIRKARKSRIHEASSLPLRRSDRLKGILKGESPNTSSTAALRRSARLKGLPGGRDVGEAAVVLDPARKKLLFRRCQNKGRRNIYDMVGICSESGGRDAPNPDVTVGEAAVVLDPARKKLLVTRCENKGRGSIYDMVGICCHFCRQKKLCGEEDCKRCSNLDVNLPCLGKTECSVCHSSNGILCRACLKVRYGEEMEEVRMMKDWMCPHCIEEKGINPFWICNSSLCLKKRKMVPTGIAIYQAREQGYLSVAHMLMEKLKGGGQLCIDSS